MEHNEIHTIDLLIIAAYLIAMVLIGLVVVRKVRNMDDYYLGGRSFGPLVLMATVCATIIGGSGLMGRAGVAYSSGFKAIMTALPYLLGMFIFSGFAGRISAVGTTFGVSSIPDLFEQIYTQVTGQPTTGNTVLEISYSIGIGLGILFFFNHFGRMKLTNDPTPMQVQMRLYEDDINTTIIEDISRNKK